MGHHPKPRGGFAARMLLRAAPELSTVCLRDAVPINRGGGGGGEGGWGREGEGEKGREGGGVT